MMETECCFIEVYFNGEWNSGEQELNRRLEGGWKIVGQNEWVEWEDGRDFPITKYKLERKVRVAGV